MSVVDAVQADLALIRECSPRIADSGLAATALELAAQLDGENSATSKSMCAKALMDCLATLRSLAPAKREADRVDDITEQREKRRRVAAAGVAAASNL